MKKFLTVLLALSVVFTYTVGSAFAATPVDPDTDITITEPVKAAVKELTDDMNEAVADAKEALEDSYYDSFGEAGNSYKLTITKAMYEKVLDQIAADYAELVKRGAEKAITENVTENLANYIKGVPVTDYITYNGANLEVKAEHYPVDANGLVGFVTEKTNTNNSSLRDYYVVNVWEEALKDAKVYLDGEFDKVDYSLYTTDIADEDVAFPQTWREMAQEAVKGYKEFVAETIAAVDAETIDRGGAVSKIYAAYSSLKWLVKEKYVVGTDGTELVLTYKLADTKIKTEEVLNGETATEDASKAALKAEVQANAAAALKEALKTPATYAEEKAKIDAYVEVWNTLIENDYEAVVAYLNGRKIPNNPTEAAYKERTDKYTEAVAIADALKIEVEKEGSLKYDATIVDENLDAVQLAIYWNLKNEVLWDADDLKDALKDGALVKADNLAWEKEVAVAKLTAEMETVLAADPGYFALEEAKVKAKYQEQIDKVNAAVSSDKLSKIATSIKSSLTIDDKSDVLADLKAFPNTAKFVKGVEDQLVVLNFQLSALSDGYRKATTLDDVVEFLAENDARTNAEVAALFGQVEAYAKALPTNAETDAADAAAKAAIEAIPTHVTLADKATVVAAYAAAKDTAYENNATLAKAVALVKALEADAIDDMIKDLPAKLTATDKAAVDAIFVAIETYEAEEMYDDAKYAKKAEAKKAFESVRDAVLADVQDAIAALSSDPTKAQVEAARSAVDEFVATYTNAAEPYQAIKKIVNLDKLTYAEAQMKVKTIKAVEGLKITASSKAAKGSMTINWKVKGDASYADGFRVYKSKKMNSGFGKTYYFQTKDNTKRSYKNTKELKKGTRYYYKVRAYVVIDGKTYFSDYSNKAYRIAK